MMETSGAGKGRVKNDNTLRKSQIVSQQALPKAHLLRSADDKPANDSISITGD
jgi:hypothetical protein